MKFADEIDKVVNDLQTYPSWIAPKDQLPFGDHSWRFQNRLHGDPLVSRSNQACYYAHYGSKPQVSIGRTTYGICDGSLQAKGLILGEIVERSVRMAGAIITRDCIQILRAGSSDTDWNIVELPDVIWRTLCADRDGKGDRAPYTYQGAMLHLLKVGSGISNLSNLLDLLEEMSSIDPEELLDTGMPEDVEQFLLVVRDIVWNRRTFRLKGVDEIDRSLVGLAPQHAKIGDQVCVLYGCSVLVVLRKLHDSADKIGWCLIGDAYVHSVMDGEAISSSTPNILRPSETEFTIW